VIDKLPALMAQAQAGGSPQEGGFNSAVADLMDGLMGIPEVGERLSESAAMLDVVGLNYGESRYLLDHSTSPNRIVVGSETFPSRIDTYWKMVSDHGHVIGDFTWTGWDYLGESGIGRPKYPGEDQDFGAAYPWLTASTGDIDITGRRRPVSYYRETVYGLRQTPYLAVQRPDRRDHAVVAKAWTWTDSVASWTWDAPVGSPVTVEAYADADEVEFHLNGRVAARATVGQDKAFVATADVPYEPGTLEAVAFRGGVETGRCRLVTAAEPSRVRVVADRRRIAADPQDLAFVEVSLVDADDTVNPVRDRTVSVEVDGPATLQGLGTARPSTEESFLAGECTTYEGAALIALRPTGAEGTAVLTVRVDGLDPVTLDIELQSSTTGAPDLTRPLEVAAP